MTSVQDFHPGPVIRFGILGDAEPKDDSFDNVAAAVNVLNWVDAEHGVDFVAGVGDLAHRGKEHQYATLTEIFSELRSPIYPILGNEEIENRRFLKRVKNRYELVLRRLRGEDAKLGISRFFQYARDWNPPNDRIEAVSYTKEIDGYVFVFATAKYDGINFTDSELTWLRSRLQEHANKAAILFIHAPPKGVFPRGKEMDTHNFQPVLSEPNVAAIFSGHAHIDLDAATTETVDNWGNPHIHVPGLERTKIGSSHTPRIRFVELVDPSKMIIRTYNLNLDQFEQRHQIEYTLSPTLDDRS